MDKDQAVGQIRHAFSAGGVGLAFLMYWMTQRGLTSDTQNAILQAVAWIIGPGGVLIGAGWSWISARLSSRIKSVAKVDGLKVEVDTRNKKTPQVAKDMANDTVTPDVRDVVPAKN